MLRPNGSAAVLRFDAGTSEAGRHYLEGMRSGYTGAAVKKLEQTRMLSRPGGLASYFWLKGAMDRMLALLILVSAGPLMVLIAWWIRRESVGPALFTQVRAGRGGKPFRLYKFRTMRASADSYGDSPRGSDDPRVTRTGRWLRETSLDELPQLINVLRGEMSLVGPRPLYVSQIAEWSERHRCRLLVKPGMTGLAQVNGRGSITMEEKLEWDARYVEDVNLKRDLEILWFTLRGVGMREGIYEVRYSAERERRGDEGAASTE